MCLRIRSLPCAIAPFWAHLVSSSCVLRFRSLSVHSTILWAPFYGLHFVLLYDLPLPISVLLSSSLVLLQYILPCFRNSVFALCIAPFRGARHHRTLLPSASRIRSLPCIAPFCGALSDLNFHLPAFCMPACVSLHACVCYLLSSPVNYLLSYLLLLVVVCCCCLLCLLLVVVSCYYLLLLVTCCRLLLVVVFVIFVVACCCLFSQHMHTRKLGQLHTHHACTQGCNLSYRHVVQPGISV